jgi:hypothetical protein
LHGKASLVCTERGRGIKIEEGEEEATVFRFLLSHASSNLTQNPNGGEMLGFPMVEGENGRSLLSFSSFLLVLFSTNIY